jgi:diaminohydroxyphosphoribosylaminopyrimidine deaminase/5-amino-6-(5-phosphoribosylamino)uracil reductase
MIPTAAVERAMRRALELAASPGVPRGPNPRVGCVLLGPDGTEVAEGFHRGAGTPHAEAAALAEAGDAANGATAVVTLEPCNHTGRTGPCAEALIKAGVVRVVFAQPDPNPVAAGGAEALRAAGIAVEMGLLEREARQLNRAWTFALEHGRPFVTWKFAASLDGRSAATDGSSKWITNEDARRDVHRLRGECDAILVGTGTVLRDDPELTVRDALDAPLPRERQPLRVIVGSRDVPPGSRTNNDAADTIQIREQPPRGVLESLRERGCQHVFLEGGPTLAGAFLRDGLVDEVVAYVAPKLLGSGRNALEAGLGTSITDALDLHVEDITVFGDNVRITGKPSNAVQGGTVQRRGF